NDSAASGKAARLALAGAWLHQASASRRSVERGEENASVAGGPATGAFNESASAAPGSSRLWQPVPADSISSNDSGTVRTANTIECFTGITWQIHSPGKNVQNGRCP